MVFDEFVLSIGTFYKLMCFVMVSQTIKSIPMKSVTKVNKTCFNVSEMES